MKRQELQQVLKLLAMVSQVGLTIVVSTGIGFFLGQLIDRLIGFKFIVTPVGTLLGIGAGFWSVFKMFRDIMSINKKDE